MLDNLNNLTYQGIAKAILEDPRCEVIKTDKERNILFDKYIKDGDEETFLIIFYANLKMARAVVNKWGKNGSDEMKLDYFQNCIIGLISAIKEYHPSKGAWPSYVFLKIETHLRNYLKTQSSFKIPSNIYLGLLKVKSTSNKLKDKNGSFTYEEIEKESGIPLEKVEEYMNFDLNTISGDSPIGKDETGNEQTVISIVEDKDRGPESFKKLLSDEHTRNVLKLELNCLTPLEKITIENYFGLNESGQNLSFKNISELVGTVTNARIGQVFKVGMKKLKNNGNLKEFFYGEGEENKDTYFDIQIKTLKNFVLLGGRDELFEEKLIDLFNDSKSDWLKLYDELEKGILLGKESTNLLKSQALIACSIFLKGKSKTIGINRKVEILIHKLLFSINSRKLKKELFNFIYKSIEILPFKIRLRKGDINLITNENEILDYEEDANKAFADRCKERKVLLRELEEKRDEDIRSGALQTKKGVKGGRKRKIKHLKPGDVGYKKNKKK